MFDLINGLPVHPLVLHGFVVFGPLAALAAIAYVVRPAWRAAMFWPTVVVAGLAAVTAFLAKESGEQLEERLLPIATAAQAELIHEHAELGDVAGAVGVLFGLLTIAVVWLLMPGVKPPFLALKRSFPPVVTTLAGVLVAGLAVAMVVVVVLAGDSGASAAWRELISQTG
ncbi:MAG: DUF2231 domain-containing protein [Arachnia sp.]